MLSFKHVGVLEGQVEGNPINSEELQINLKDSDHVWSSCILEKSYRRTLSRVCIIGLMNSCIVGLSEMGVVTSACEVSIVDELTDV